MEPSPSSAPQDIGPTVAVVGTNGWRCCLCNTTFQRSFSIEHHMIMNHHPLPNLSAPSTQDGERSTNPSSVGVGGQQVTMAQDGDNTVQETESQREASHDHTRSSSESAGAVSVCLPKSSHTVTEASNAVIPPAERRCQMQDGNLMVKVESTVAVTQAACAKALPQASSEGCVDEDLPVHFPAKFGPHTANPSAQSHSQDTSSVCNASSPEAKVPRIQCSPLSSPWIMSSCSAEEYSKVNPANSSAAGPGPPVNLCSQLAARRSCRAYKRQVCCGQVFESKPEFKQHRRVAHGRGRMKTFDCHICGSQYAHKRGLNRHLDEKGSLLFTCADCPERFHSQLSLEAHRRNCHRTDSGVHDPRPLHGDGRAGGCDHHDAPTTTADSGVHEQMKNDPWECSRCKKHFYDKPDFRKHLVQCGILRCENGVRLFYCNLCPASFQWLVQFHRHYVNDHKLPSLAEARSSPVPFSPFLGNSPVPSPAPSVTSEINTAMAGVDLNHSSASSITGSSSPLTSTVDLTADHSPEFGMSELSREEEDGGSGLGSNPLSLASFTSTSEQLSAEEAVVVSDEDSMGSDSSLDSDSEWEMVQGQDGEKGHDTKESDHKGSDAGDCHRGRGHHSGMHPPFGYPPPPPHHHPGRPPPPHHPPPWDHPGDPPHPFHFRPPPPPPHHPHHHPHHHHGPPRPWSGWGRFCRERGPRFHGPHFSGPGWFNEFSGDECTTEAQGPTPASTAAFSATEGVAQTKPSGTRTPAAEQETGGSRGAAPSQGRRDEDHSEDSAPFRNFPPFFWAGKHREKKLAKKVFLSLLKNSLYGGTVFCCPDCLQMFSGETAFHAHCQEEHPASPQARYYVCFMCHYTCAEPVLYNKHIHQHCKEIVQNRGQGRAGGHGQWMMGHGRGMHRMFKMLFKAFGPYGPPFARGHPSWETEKDSNDSDSHKEQFKECPYCQKKFKANSRENFFERHVNAHAGLETYNFKCEECGKTFLEKAKFTAHQASHQSSLFVCHCGKKYQSKTSLTRHQRIHNGERPYKCEVCGEGFIENRELVRHSMVHTGEAPYKCHECGKRFTLQTSLKTHIKKQHPVSSHQVTHRCADCSQVFSDLLELSNHHRVCAGRQRNDTLSDENLRSGRVKEEPSNMDLD